MCRFTAITARRHPTEGIKYILHTCNLRFNCFLAKCTSPLYCPHTHTCGALNTTARQFHQLSAHSTEQIVNIYARFCIRMPIASKLAHSQPPDIAWHTPHIKWIKINEMLQMRWSYLSCESSERIFLVANNKSYVFIGRKNASNIHVFCYVLCKSH